MQKVYFLLIVLLSLSFVPKAEASHNIGGEITWECLNDGRYVFKMKLYVNCSGASWPFNRSEDLKIFGSPLPTDSNNQAIQNINLIRDSVRWVETNFGDLSPDCNPNNFANNLSCANGSSGSIQVFYYKSAPIQLNGTPPSDGWHFRYELICCRPNSRNLVGGASGAILLRSVMYSDQAGTNVQSCIDSSPEFVELPRVPFCLSYPIKYNQSAVDSDGDNLVYKWAKTYDRPAANPAERGYASGFNYDNPTPDQNFNPLNKAAHIDNNSGIVNLEVHNRGFLHDWFVTVVEVASYRDGHKVSSIFREVPYMFYDCPPIDSTTPNKQPDFYFDNLRQNEYEIVVEAGDKVEFPVQLVDNDSGATGLPQEVSLFTFGNQFSADFVDTANCANPPCAILTNNVPQYDSSRNRYQISGANTVTTNFEWQTNCGHLNADGSQKTYYFYFSGKDDHCPVPQQVDTYVKVTVKGDSINYSLAMECAGDKGSYNHISWLAGADLAIGFDKWFIYAGNTTSQLQLIDSLSNFNTQEYVDSAKYNYYQVKTITTCNYQKNKLKTKIFEVDYFSILSDPNVIQIECVEELTSTNTVSWSVDKSIENEFKQWYIYAGNTPPLQLVDSIAGFNTRAYVDNQKLAYYQVKASISSVCVNDTVTLESIIRRRGYQRYPIDVSISDSNRIITAQDSAADSYQWYDCNADTVITDSIRQSFAPQDSGSFAAIITKGYCTDTTECVKVFSVGLNENHFQNSINFYPNPTEGSVTIKTGAIQESLHLKVRNIHGQLVQEEQFDNQSNLQLQLNGKPGIYFIELVNEQGERANVKVVKR